MAALNEGPPVWSLKPDAFEHYSQPLQINIAVFPHRLFAVIKTLSQRILAPFKNTKYLADETSSLWFL